MTITADLAYIRQSILNPSAQIVAGYEDFMRSFSDLGDEDLHQLVAYIRSLED